MRVRGKVDEWKKKKSGQYNSTQYNTAQHNTIQYRVIASWTKTKGAKAKIGVNMAIHNKNGSPCTYKTGLMYTIHNTQCSRTKTEPRIRKSQKINNKEKCVCTVHKEKKRIQTKAQGTRKYTK